MYKESKFLFVSLKGVLRGGWIDTLGNAIRTLHTYLWLCVYAVRAFIEKEVLLFVFRATIIFISVAVCCLLLHVYISVTDKIYVCFSSTLRLIIISSSVRLSVCRHVCVCISALNPCSSRCMYFLRMLRIGLL